MLAPENTKDRANFNLKDQISKVGQDSQGNDEWFENYQATHELYIVTRWHDFTRDPLGFTMECAQFIWDLRTIPGYLAYVIPYQLWNLYNLTMHPAQYVKPDGF